MKLPGRVKLFSTVTSRLIGNGVGAITRPNGFAAAGGTSFPQAIGRAVPKLGVTRPISELKGCLRTHLMAGESKTVEFAIGSGELSFSDEGMKRVVEPGRFEVMVGGSSADLKKVDLEVAAR